MADLLPSNMTRSFLRKRKGKIRAIEREKWAGDLTMEQAFAIHAKQGRYPAAPIYGGS